MTAFVLIALAILVFWGVIASILSLDSDGYGRPEISDRTRHAQNAVRWDAR
ncbi:hypothetical protein [Orlajensenia flava]|uniref:hypothetical protein n=1 Tax=Orlajensenia flava TaxID=2565934 RepID=UPI001455CF5A|nr:hypothetical protein [Glaciibacter flavus]